MIIPPVAKVPRVEAVVAVPLKTPATVLPFCSSSQIGKEGCHNISISKINLFLSFKFKFCFVWGAFPDGLKLCNILETPARSLRDPKLEARGLGEAPRLRIPGSPQLGEALVDLEV